MEPRREAKSSRSFSKARILRGTIATPSDVKAALLENGYLDEEGKEDYSILGVSSGSIANLFSEAGIKKRTWIQLRPKLAAIGISFDDENVELFHSVPKDGENDLEESNTIEDISSSRNASSTTDNDIAGLTEQETEPRKDSPLSWTGSRSFEPKKVLSIVVLAISCVSFVTVTRSGREPVQMPKVEQTVDHGYLASDSTSLNRRATLHTMQQRIEPSNLTWRTPALSEGVGWDLRVFRSQTDDVVSLDSIEGTLRNGDRIKLRVYSKEPLYHQLYWFDSSGEPYSLATDAVSKVERTTMFELPPAQDEFFVLNSKNGGLHAIVAVSSREPIAVSALPSALPQPKNKALFEQGPLFFDNEGLVVSSERGPPIQQSATSIVNDPVGVLASMTKSNLRGKVNSALAVCFVISLDE